VMQAFLMDNPISKVAKILKKSENILFITGAGLSADSGLPTYRGVGGLYDDKHTDEGIPIEDALSGEMLPEKALKQMHRLEKMRMDAVLSVGTSGAFPYISGPVVMARRAGIPTVEINPTDTVLSDMVDIKINGGAADTLDKIWKEIKLKA
jgi:NAD-dependent SIR2 family protein deacetylase